MSETEVRAYPVPVRAVWRGRQDRIELRILSGERADPDATVQDAVTVHVGLGERILAITVPDSKRLRLGQWLRQNWAAATPPQGRVEIQVYYDEAGRLLHFAFEDLALLERDYVRRAMRRATFHLSPAGHLCEVSIPVSSRRRRDGDLGVGAGYLPSR